MTPLFNSGSHRERCQPTRWRPYVSWGRRQLRIGVRRAIPAGTHDEKCWYRDQYRFIGIEVQ